MMTIELHVRKLLPTWLTPEHAVLVHARITMSTQVGLLLEVCRAVFTDVCITQQFHIDINAKAG